MVVPIAYIVYNKLLHTSVVRVVVVLGRNYSPNNAQMPLRPPPATLFSLATGNFRPQERRACLANCTSGDHTCKIKCDLHEQAGLEDSPRPCSQLAYEAFHYRAIERARAARAKRKQGKHGEAYDEMLKAYVTEGFGLHFATDLFAAGHQRTPAFEMREGVGRDTNKVKR